MRTTLPLPSVTPSTRRRLAARLVARARQLLPALVLPALAACGDPTGPKSVHVELTLTAVNGQSLPAIGVEGTCYRGSLFGGGSYYPDSLRIDAGHLTLDRGKYALYYTWRGATVACTPVGQHWHRSSAGTYDLAGNTILFQEDPTEPGPTPTTWGQGSPGTPAGTAADRTFSTVRVRWGSLTLDFAR